MNTTELSEIKLIGLSLKRKTTNTKGQSAVDCGNLWQEFEKGKYTESIPNKISDEVFAVYHQYEGDHTKPFSYFIGCKVKTVEDIPAGLESIIIPRGTYAKVTARGKMPDCIMNAWKEIWASGIPRAYKIDFEIYDKRSNNWDNAEVDIFLSIKK